MPPKLLDNLRYTAFRSGLACILSVVVSCASGSRTPDATSSATPEPNIAPLLGWNDADATLLVTANRQGEFAVCGCSFYPIGGFDREWNLRRASPLPPKERLVVLSAGTVFNSGDPYVKSDETMRRADLVLEGLRGMGTRAVAPTADDAALGWNVLRDFEKRAGFPFVSADLLDATTGKPPFAPYLDVTLPKGTIVVTGISRTANPLAKDVRLVPLARALKAAETHARDKGAVLVVLHALTEKDRVALQLSAKVPTVFLGGEAKNSFFGFFQGEKRAIVGNPKARGRELLRLDLKLPEKAGEFFNSLVAESTVTRENELRKYLKNKATNASRRREYGAQLAELANVPREAKPTSVQYTFTAGDLPESLAMPKNEFSDMQSRFDKKPASEVSRTDQP